MSFQVNLTNGTTLTTLADQTIDTTSCSVALLGRAAPNYAPAAENRIAHMLENFANTTAPSAPVIGQLWWNSAASPSPMMMVYTGTTNGWVSGLGVNPTVTTQTNNTYNNTIATTQYVYNQLTQVFAGTITPLMDGVAAVGVSIKFAHEDHVHPTDTSRAPIANPTFTGVPAAPTAVAGTNTTQLATTAFVATAISTTIAGTITPLMNAIAAVGTSSKFAREDHVHPTDTTRASINSPFFTGVPQAPTAAAGTNTTQLATCAFVTAAIAGGGGGGGTISSITLAASAAGLSVAGSPLTASGTLTLGTTLGAGTRLLLTA